MLYSKENKFMKHVITILAFLCTVSVIAQNKQFSTENQKHWDKFVTFVEDATNDNDYQLAINELEQILLTDTSCPDVYYNLGALHSKLILKGGQKDADKAKEHFKQYQLMVPSDSEKINSEYSKIEARLEKYKNDKKSSLLEAFVGKWKRDIYLNDGSFFKSDKMEIFFNDNGLNILSPNFKSADNIKFENEKICFSSYNYMTIQDLIHEKYDYSPGGIKHDACGVHISHELSLTDNGKLCWIKWIAMTVYFLNGTSQGTEEGEIRNSPSLLERVY